MIQVISHFSVGPKNGFTILEIALGLLIVGLLSASVLVGRDLIFAAQIRGTVEQFHKYNAATNTFFIKYNSHPGDHPDPTIFGGAAASAGNDDGIIGECPLPSLQPCSYETISDAGRINAESINFWHHLSAAGLMENTFHLPIASDYTPPDPQHGYYMWLGGTTTPQAKIKHVRGAWTNPESSGWGVTYNPKFHDTGMPDAEIKGHVFLLMSIMLGGDFMDDGGAGGGHPGIIGAFPTPGGWFPWVLFSIDTKTDDGKPFEGDTLIAQGTGRKATFQFYSVAPPDVAHPEIPSCIVSDGGEWHYNVQQSYTGEFGYGLCGLAMKAAF